MDPESSGLRKTHGSRHVAVGRVVRAWGTKGEIKIESLTDFPDRFAPRKTLYIGGTPYTVERSRHQKSSFIVKLAAVDDPSAAERLRGALLEIPVEEVRRLPAGEHYWFEVIGLEVVDTNNEPVGRVEGILPTGSNDVYIVRTQRGEILIPATDEVVKAVDLEKGRMIIHFVDGLR